MGYQPIMDLGSFRWREARKAQTDARKETREAEARRRFTSTAYHDELRSHLADHVGGYAKLAIIEDKLAEWHDSIAECCRRGIVGAPQILRVVHIYTSLDLLDTRPPVR